jgi:hypothetical protein
MKRLISIGLALSLLGSSAAFAHDSGRDSHGSYSHSAPYRGGYGYRDNNGAAAAVGLGILALGVFGALAAQNNSHYDRSYYAPPPRYDYGNYGHSNYGYNYGPNYGSSYRYGR